MFRETYISLADFYMYQHDFAENGWIASVDHNLLTEGTVFMQRVYAVHPPHNEGERWGLLVSRVGDKAPTKVMMAQADTRIYLRKPSVALIADPVHRFPVEYRVYNLGDPTKSQISGSVRAPITGKFYSLSINFSRYSHRRKGLPATIQAFGSQMSIQEAALVSVAIQQAVAIQEAMKDLTIFNRIDPVIYMAQHQIA